MRRLSRVCAAFVTVLVALTLSGCGGGSSSTPASAQSPKVITITVKGDSVTPNGQRVSAVVGQPIELKVTADAPGEIHVHSSPEQEFEYKAGSSVLDLTPIKTPGVVTIESHTLDKVIVQLQVQ